MVFLLAAAVCPDPAVAQESPVDALVAAGDAAFEVLDNAGASRLFEEARAAAGDPTPFGLLARLSRTRNDYGMDLVAEGREEDGERELEIALAYALELTERHPDRAESWFLLAAGYGNMALFKGGREKVRIGRAVEEYCLKAIALDPDFAPPYAVLGIFYREIAELNWVQRTLARTLFGGLPDGSYERSEELLRRAVALDPAMPLGYFELGRTLYRSGRREDARPWLEQAITLEPVSTLDVRNAAEARQLLEGY